MTRDRLIDILSNNSRINTTELFVEIDKHSKKDISSKDFDILLKCAAGEVPANNPITYHDNVSKANALLQMLSANILDYLKIEHKIVFLTDKDSKIIRVL